MANVARQDDFFPDFELPPTEDELPSDDGMPMETARHVFQMILLMLPLKLYWKDRTDVCVGGNMFVYYSPAQLLTEDFRGPDVFVATGVANRERKSWLVWQEGKGPDVVIELLSDSTARRDKGEKMRIYQDKLRVPEYFWYDPFTAEFAGFALREGVYEPITSDSPDRLPSRLLGLSLVRWQGTYEGVEARWLRWATLDGTVLPTDAEVAERERQAAAEANRRIAELEARLARYERPGQGA